MGEADALGLMEGRAPAHSSAGHPGAAPPGGAADARSMPDLPDRVDMPPAGTGWAVTGCHLPAPTCVLLAWDIAQLATGSRQNKAWSYSLRF